MQAQNLDTGLRRCDGSGAAVRHPGGSRDPAMVVEASAESGRRLAPVWRGLVRRGPSSRRKPGSSNGGRCGRRSRTPACAGV